MEVFVSCAFNDANKSVEEFAIPLVTVMSRTSATGWRIEKVAKAGKTAGG
jgi:hypothetical protein